MIPPRFGAKPPSRKGNTRKRSEYPRGSDKYRAFARTLFQSEAKRLVHYRQAWAHRREADEKLHDALYKLEEDD